MHRVSGLSTSVGNLTADQIVDVKVAICNTCRHDGTIPNLARSSPFIEVVPHHPTITSCHVRQAATLTYDFLSAGFTDPRFSLMSESC
jgi:hypothetical protein